MRNMRTDVQKKERISLCLFIHSFIRSLFMYTCFFYHILSSQNPRNSLSILNSSKNCATKMKGEPKAAQSSFFLWMNQNRDRFYKPGMTQADIAVVAGDEWRLLPDDEKAKWAEKAAEDKERYVQQKAEQIKHKEVDEEDEEEHEEQQSDDE